MFDIIKSGYSATQRLIPLRQRSLILRYQLSFTKYKTQFSNHWRDGRGKIVIAIAIGWLLSMGVRLMYPILLPYLRYEYTLTLTDAGLLLTVLWLAYGLGQLPSGLLTDRIPSGSVMVASTMIAAMALMFVVLGNSTTLLFVATGLFGFGTALYAVSRYAVLSEIYPDQLGTAVGLTAAAGDVGNTILPPIASLLAASIAWQLGFGFVIPLFIISSVSLWLTLPNKTHSQERTVRPNREGLARLKNGLKNANLLKMTGIQVLGVLVWQAFTGFYPTYLMQVKDFSTGVASGLFALFFALGILIKPLLGWAYDRIGARRSLLVIIGMSSTGLLLMPIAEGEWAFIGLTGMAGAMLGRGPVAQSFITNRLPSEIQNTGFGTLRAIYLLLGALGPLAFGIIADEGYFDEGFILLGGIMMLIFLIALQLPEEGYS